jgi:hypothetical protein
MVPANILAMTFQTVGDARFVQVGGQRLLVRCYDPDTGDVVALWPSEVSEDPSEPGHFVAASIPKRHPPDEYVPEDDPGSWPVSGPCAELPRA